MVEQPKRPLVKSGLQIVVPETRPGPFKLGTQNREAAYCLLDPSRICLTRTNACDGNLTTQEERSRIPCWDRRRRVLSVNRQIVKWFLRPAPNQEIILSAFEEEGWPFRIDDPLPPADELVAKTRLHDTIRWLNRNQRNRLLRFKGDGSGLGLCWYFVELAVLSQPEDTAAKLRHAV